MATTWRDLLRDASFRGVPFKVISADTAVGRRNVLHQYPFKEMPYLEDLGGDADEYRVEGYIVQHQENDFNYFTERDALIDALKEKGPGTLVHPFLGELEVGLVGKAHVTENFREGGVARFSMTFVLAGEPGPAYFPDYDEEIDDVAQRATDYTKDGFGLNYITEAVTGAASSEVIEWVKDGYDMMRSTIKTIQKAGASAVSYADSIIGTYRGAVSLSIVTEPLQLLDSVVGSFNGYLSLAGLYGNIGIREVLGEFSDRVRGVTYGPVEEPQAVVGNVTKDMGKSTALACLEITRYGESPGMPQPSSYGGWLKPVDIRTSTEAKMSLNQRMLINLFRNLAIINAARIAVRVTYDSADEAIEVMETIVEALDNQLLRLGDEHWEDYEKYGLAINNNDLFEALQALRPVFVKAMIAIGATLATIVDYIRGVNVESALTLAHKLYNDIDREEDIINRNRPTIKHPGFLPGGVGIEVLSE